ncbi:extracellular solute-binding protein [Microlunatus panaciterrae]|uniref:extracellular solute-binding protein n=1 Tax=Microlunatus panaciterrae TaxID=400768 RepID=UPI003084546E
MPKLEVVTTRALSRRDLFKGGGAAALAALGATSGCSVVSSGRDAAAVRPNKEPAPGRRTEIEIYNNFGADVGSGVVSCAKAFEEYQDEIAVRVTFAPSTGDSVQQKLFTAMAGGQAPDVGFTDASLAPAWTKLGMMLDLTPYFERDGIRLEDFFPVCAASMAYRDRIWSVQWDADANFPFFWNKTLFAKCGLDPERPPKTVDEIDAMSKEINRVKDGRATQVGMIPWDQYGANNSILTWGYAFGGELWKKGTNIVTPDNDLVVEALEWMARYAKSVGGPSAVAVAPPSLQAHPFSTGKIGMAGLVTPNLLQVKELNPDMEIGATLLPYQPPGASHPGQGAWLGGWSAFIPAGAPEPDAAWEFIKWLGISEEGTAAEWEHIGFPVGYQKASINAKIAADPVAGVYHETLSKMQNTRPLITVNDFYGQQMEEKVQAAVYGQVTPLQAMRQVKELTVREAHRFERVG